MGNGGGGIPGGGIPPNMGGGGIPGGAPPIAPGAPAGPAENIVWGLDPPFRSAAFCAASRRSAGVPCLSPRVSCTAENGYAPQRRANLSKKEKIKERAHAGGAQCTEEQSIRPRAFL